DDVDEVLAEVGLGEPVGVRLLRAEPVGLEGVEGVVAVVGADEQVDVLRPPPDAGVARERVRAADEERDAGAAEDGEDALVEEGGDVEGGRGEGRGGGGQRGGSGAGRGGAWDRARRRGRVTALTRCTASLFSPSPSWNPPNPSASPPSPTSTTTGAPPGSTAPSSRPP